VAPSTRKKLARTPHTQRTPAARTDGPPRTQRLVAVRGGEQPSYVGVMRLIGVALLASPLALAAACGPSSPDARPPGGMQPVNVPPEPSASIAPTAPVPLGGAPMPVTPGPATSGASSAPTAR
jgi:hypothetical protein